MKVTSGQKTQGGQKTQRKPIGEGFLDQIKEISSDVRKSLRDDLLKPIPQESIEQLFPWAHPADLQKPKEEILFDGEEERKKQAIIVREKQNQQKILELQQLLKAEQAQVQRQVEELVETIEEVAKAAEIEVPQAVKNVPKKSGRYHVLFFVRLLADMRKKADEAREWRRAQQLRVRTKPTRGALLWVGDQKKVHEAGATFLLQG